MPADYEQIRKSTESMLYGIDLPIRNSTTRKKEMVVLRDSLVEYQASFLGVPEDAFASFPNEHFVKNQYCLQSMTKIQSENFDIRSREIMDRLSDSDIFSPIKSQRNMLKDVTLNYLLTNYKSQIKRYSIEQNFSNMYIQAVLQKSINSIKESYQLKDLNTTAKELNKKGVSEHTFLDDILEKTMTDKKYEPVDFKTQDAGYTFNDIGGYKTQKEMIRKYLLANTKKADLAKELGITPPKGILLYGPPGTGKTSFARAISSQEGFNFYAAKGSDFIDPYKGVGKNMIRDLFAAARDNSPAIIFIDEIDCIAPDRKSKHGESNTSEITQLITELDGFEKLKGVVTIGSTNRRDAIDEAILRPGRLDIHIEFGIPTREDRHDILRVLSKKYSLEDSIDLEKLTDMTEKFSPSALNNMLNLAGYEALDEDARKISMKHIGHSLKIANKK